MNRILFLALLAILTFSCKKEQAGLDKLKADRALLHNQIVALDQKISMLDIEIAKFDTVKRPVLITTMPIESNHFEHFFEVQGTIEADKNVVLYPEIGGLIKYIHVKEGDKVRRGQKLVTLDSELIELQLKELETSLELSTTSYERQKRLWDQNIGSEMQYLQLKNQKESLENRIATLQAQKRKYRLAAPFTGVVDEIWSKTGEMTSPASQVLRLINLDNVYINADVSEAYLGKISEKSDVEVYFPSYGKIINAQVDFLGNYINPNNRTFRIQVNVPNEDNLIKPNLMAYLRIKDFEQAQAFILPDRLIQENPSGGKFVYIAKNKSGITTVYKKDIQIGLSYKNKTLIHAGVDSSTILVNKGARSIKDGQTVQVVRQ